MKKKRIQKDINILLISNLCRLIFSAAVIAGSIGLYHLILLRTNPEAQNGYKQYGQHYAFIMDDRQSGFFGTIYDAAAERGREMNIFVEKWGEGMTSSYSANELVKIAIAARVDGIIMQGHTSADRLDCINMAFEKGIPVITVYEDCPDSQRCSFIGGDNQRMGEEYANYIQNMEKNHNITVVIGSGSTSGLEIFNVIETVLAESNHDFNLQAKYIDRASAFESKDKIRKILADQEIDILVCLAYIDTLSASQIIEELGLENEIGLLGYYQTEITDIGIENEIITAVVTLDTYGIGVKAVESMDEYIRFGNTADTVTVENRLIDLQSFQNIDR